MIIIPAAFVLLTATQKSQRGIGGGGKRKSHSQECNACKGVNYHLLHVYAMDSQKI